MPVKSCQNVEREESRGGSQCACRKQGKVEVRGGVASEGSLLESKRERRAREEEQSFQQSGQASPALQWLLNATGAFSMTTHTQARMNRQCVFQHR